LKEIDFKTALSDLSLLSLASVQNTHTVNFIEQGKTLLLPIQVPPLPLHLKEYYEGILFLQNKFKENLK